MEHGPTFTDMYDHSSFLTMSPSQIQEIVDTAALQSDRYLFVVGIIILVVLLVIYGVYQTKWVRSLVDEIRKDREQSNEVIKANTIALTRVADRMH